MGRLFPRIPSEVRIPLITSFWIVSLAITINDRFVEVTKIDGTSMAPTLSPAYHATGRRDCVAWRKWQPTRGLARGDVVHFGNPANPEGNAVKRVIGLEGDTILLDRRRRPWKNNHSSGAEGSDCIEGHTWDVWKGKVVVPPGHIWVEGDNREKSRDSNWYGPISRSLITGKAVAVVWPLDRWGSTPWEGFRTKTKVIPGAPQVDPRVHANQMDER